MNIARRRAAGNEIAKLFEYLPFQPSRILLDTIVETVLQHVHDMLDDVDRSPKLRKED